MNRYLRVGRLILVSAMVALGLVWTSGCGETPATAPAASGGAPRLMQYSPEQSKQLQLDGMLGTGNKELVKAGDGGTVEAGNFTLVIPEGALAQNTLISLIPTDPNTMVCDIEPSGLQFLKPVTLTFNYRGTSADPTSRNYVPGSLVGVWMDPNISQWVGIGGTDNSKDLEFSVPLSHLSYYALSK